MIQCGLFSSCQTPAGLSFPALSLSPLSAILDLPVSVSGRVTDTKGTSATQSGHCSPRGSPTKAKPLGLHEPLPFSAPTISPLAPHHHHLRLTSHDSKQEVIIIKTIIITVSDTNLAWDCHIWTASRTYGRRERFYSPLGWCPNAPYRQGVIGSM